ncbi:cadherin-17 [Pristis pectinata]|uniref:cadherin-17 n=1 Tax=Pristis pectinata TaxID=685728 RepID=UPI00223CCF89|nr:cadherin-17 [Pristis pectinata]XP_051879704.1 cadherin-17 [Pristis pectinata]XP_051879705.1 cadherin-17 [Pristis pectinata]
MRTSSHQHFDQLLLLFVALVLIRNINGILPKGPLKSMNLTVVEGTTVPFFLYQFQSTNSAVKSFRITAGETHGRLHIEEGWLYLNITVDREEQAIYKLQIEGLNGEQKVVEGPVTVMIIVQDINDNQPTFAETEYKGVVWQNSRPGKPFMEVKAEDLDDPNTPNGKIEYSISQQIPSTDHIMLFQVDKETGAISTTEKGYELLDPGQVKQYDLVVVAKDLAELSLSTSTIVKIDVKENLWKSPGKIEVPENSSDPLPKTITKVQWNTPGAIFDLKPKDNMFYRSFPFVIDANGDINVTDSLDREEISNYVLLVYALDKNREPLEKPLEIVVIVKDVNDNSPVCKEAVTFLEVQENEQMGSNIGSVLATDLDEEGTKNSMLKYKILDQEPKIPEDNMFKINDFEGTIQRFNGKLEKKNAPEYLLRVQVTDQMGIEGGLSTECLVNISVIDINDKIPIFESPKYGPITLEENTSLNKVLIEIQATDDDEALTGSSEILYNVVDGDENGTFKIITDKSTNRGLVQLAKPLDFEARSVFELNISATNPEPLVDGVYYNLSSFTLLFVNVTDDDEPPRFLKPLYQQWIFENASKGDVLLKVEAYDPEGSAVRYQLTDDPRKWFYIDPQTGEIFTNGNLDMEKERMYNIRVTAMEEDNPSKKSTVDIYVHLQDVNDNPPKLAEDSSWFFICIPADEEKKITIHAVDDDVELGPPFKFSVDKVPGRQWTINPINDTHASVIMRFGKHEEETQYKIPVTVTDSGFPSQKGNDFITVKVCKCTDSKVCFLPVDQSPYSKVGLALGILLGTLAVIGLILLIVFLKMKPKKHGKADINRMDRTEKETIPLTNA